MKKLLILFVTFNSFLCLGQDNEFLEQPIFLDNPIVPRATLLIDLIPGQIEITKPLIIAEGFDPGSVTSPEKEFGDSDITDFIGDIRDFNEVGNLATLLDDSQEYDIIYVNWTNGTDDIKENAKVLKAVIDWVNTNKQGDEPNVLLGQSMGGLIGRYTLAKMEKDGQNHDVRLFIAHDSPMQGANTPLSTQYFSRHIYDNYTEAPVLYGFLEYVIPTFLNFADLLNIEALDIAFPSVNDILTIQDTPAALQLNNHYVDILSHPTMQPHQIWQQEFDAMGYPENSRNIAISNGNECATDHGFNAGEKFIDLNSQLSPAAFGELAGMIIDFSIGILTTDINLAILGIFPGSSTYNFDFDIHSNPSIGATNRNVYYGRVRYEKKLFGIIKVTHTITERSKTAPVGYLPFDTYSGGYYDITNATNSLPITLSNSIFVNPLYGFIPVVSALDIKRNNGPVNPTDYLKQYAGGSTPEPALTSGFDNFIVDYNNGNPINNEHISFQVRNGDWLAEELQVDENAPVYPSYNCSFICDNTEISGPETICTSNTFSVPAGGVSYTWSITGSAASITPNGNIATVTRIGQQNSRVTIRVTINGGDCGTVTLAKQVWVGVPKFNSLIPIGNQNGYSPEEPSVSIGMNGEGCNQIRMKVLFDADALLEYQWEKFTTDVAWSVNASSGNILISPQCNTNFSFRVRVRNSCGWSAWQQFEFPLTRCTIACDIPADPSPIVGANFLVSPNPVTSGLVTIGVKADAPWFLIPEINDPLNPSHNTGGNQLLERIRVNMSIFNSLGILVQQYTNLLVHPTPAQINISNLPSGSYIIIFEYFGQTESYTIIKS